MDPLRDNPFLILELPPSCSAMDVERQGRKLLSMLELDLDKAATYATPFGPAPRTPEKVREAMALLRDAVKRKPYELWARAPVDDVEVEDGRRAGWSEAFAPLWWRT